MNYWKENAIVKLFGIELPIIQAPMAGANGADMVIAVSKAGGLGSLPCAMLSTEQIQTEVAKIRAQTKNPINLNFFCHQNPKANSEKEMQWKKRLEKYYIEFGIDLNATAPSANRRPFDQEVCDVVLEVKPEVVSFHFGLPEKSLMEKLKQAKIKVIASATTVDEARFLEEHGCDAIIAQGFEAGGHRGIFLSNDITTQVGTMALVPQMVDAVKVPVIASGGICDARGVVAALALGASAAQLGTAYLYSSEATISAVHRAALKKVKDNETVLTNVFSGRPARGIANRMTKEVGPISELAPDFPLAGVALAPLKQKTEPQGSGDFMSLWSGQAAALCHEDSSTNITLKLAAEAQELLEKLCKNFK
jgi:nitronate monooxygenase